MRRLGRYMVVVALIFAVGGHWAFLQSIAWFGMTVEYSKHSSFLEALEMTFSGDHPCKLCKAVDAGKKAERKQAVVKGETKLEFPQIATAFLIYPPVILDRPMSELFPPDQPLSSPPTPPPRVG